MPRVQIRVDDPPTDWLIDLSRAHPDAEFRILASYPSEGGAVGILEARTRNPDSVLAGLREAESLHSFERMDADDGALLVEYHTPEPEMQALVFESGSVPHYPVVFRDGTITVTRSTSHEQLANLTDAFESAGVEYEIRFLVQSLTPDDLLTARQRECIERAVDLGYYETPRRCSLTEFASEIGIHKTTAGDVLHRAEGRIIAAFVSTNP